MIIRINGKKIWKILDVVLHHVYAIAAITLGVLAVGLLGSMFTIELAVARILAKTLQGG
jgi:hypothetical protein